MEILQVLLIHWGIKKPTPMMKGEINLPKQMQMEIQHNMSMMQITTL